MKKKNLRPLILSSLAALAMAGVGTGATFALFTDKAETTIVVEAGTVDIETSLKKTTFYSAVADSQGTLVDENQAHYKHEPQTNGFINGGTVEINGSNIVLTNITPGDKAVIRIKLDNKSTVKTKYRFVYGTGEGDSKLLAGLEGSISEVTLNGEQEVLTKIASLDGTTRFVSAWEATDAVAKNSSKTIKELELVLELPIDAGNVYQGKSAHINFSVEAVQSNASLPAENLTRTDSVRIDENGVSKKTATLAADGVVELPVFANDTTLEKLVIAEGITRLEGRKFLQGTQAMEIAELPNSLQSIGDRVFYKSGLKSVSIPADVTEIEQGAFQECAELKGPIVIPAGVTELDATFNGSPKVSNVSFAQGSALTTLGTSVFDGTDVSTIYLPSGVTSIGSNCFRDSSIAKVYFAGTEAPYIHDNAFQIQGQQIAAGKPAVTNLYFKSDTIRNAAIAKYKAAYDKPNKPAIATDDLGSYATQSLRKVYFLVGE